MNDEASLTLQVDDGKRVFIDSYGFVEVTRGENYEGELFDFPFCEVADVDVVLSGLQRLRDHLDSLAYAPEVELFKQIAKRIDSAESIDASANDYWQDYLTEEDVAALNDVVQEWLDEPLNDEEADFASIPTNPYDYAWEMLSNSNYDTDTVGLEFVEGLRPGDSGRYIFLEKDIEEANKICERERIGLRFERMNPSQ